MRVPKGRDSLARVSAVILGVVGFPVFLVVAEWFPAGTLRSICFLAAGAAAIAAVALIAEYLEVRVDPGARGRSTETRGQHSGR